MTGKRDSNHRPRALFGTKVEGPLMGSDLWNGR
jgi:hypothetical protein